MSLDVNVEKKHDQAYLQLLFPIKQCTAWLLMILTGREEWLVTVQLTKQHVKYCDVRILIIYLTGKSMWKPLLLSDNTVRNVFPPCWWGIPSALKIFHAVRFPCSWLASSTIFFLLSGCQNSASVNHHNSTVGYSKLQQGALRLRIIWAVSWSSWTVTATITTKKRAPPTETSTASTIQVQGNVSSPLLLVLAIFFWFYQHMYSTY